jgi:alpha-glucosidase
VLQHYRQTLAFRKQHPALLDGDMTFLDTREDVLAFTRKKGDETLLFVFNLSRKPVKVALPEGVKVVKAVPMPGFGEGNDNDRITLAALDVFCGKVE